MLTMHSKLDSLLSRSEVVSFIENFDLVIIGSEEYFEYLCYRRRLQLDRVLDKIREEEKIKRLREFSDMNNPRKKSSRFNPDGDNFLDIQFRIFE